MPRVLLVRFSSIGDILLTTPLVRALKRRHPDAELWFVTKQSMAPLVSDNPRLSGIVALGPNQSVIDLARTLRDLRPTHGLDLHGSLRSAALKMLVRCRWSGYSKRKFARTTLIASKIDLYGKHVPVAERYFEAARDFAIQPDGEPPEFFLSPAAQERARQWLVEHRLTQDRPLAAVAPGAAHATKRWPLEHWRALVDRLQRLGYAPVAVGGADDRELCKQLGDIANAAGEFSLQETGACLARARVVVSGDTGVMHMAAAVATPVVTLFGPTVEAFGFFPYTKRAVVVERDMRCRPCSTMGTEHCPLGHHRCLVDILPDQVAAAVQQLVA